MRDCNLFKRSFTDKGIGFTFNNEIGKKKYKMSKNNKVLKKVMSVNEENRVANMRKAGSKYALAVLLENNREEVLNFENDGSMKLKPVNVEVTLHNPKEPANIRSNSFKLPLGYSTIVYITPKARIIDQSGKDLSEEQRGCRLSEDNQNLNIFQTYTQEGCFMECKIRQAHQRCGCFPWNYLVTKVHWVAVV